MSNLPNKKHTDEYHERPNKRPVRTQKHNTAKAREQGREDTSRGLYLPLAIDCTCDECADAYEQGYAGVATIIPKMIDDGVAKNVFQAAHIANGLRLVHMKDEAAQVNRYKLYRKWRKAGYGSERSYKNAIENITDIPVE